MKYRHIKPHQKTGLVWLSESSTCRKTPVFPKKIGRFHPSYIRFKRVDFFFKPTEVYGYQGLHQYLRTFETVASAARFESTVGVGERRELEVFVDLSLQRKKGGFYQTHWGVTCSTCSCDTFRCGCPRWKLFEIAQCTPGSAKKSGELIVSIFLGWIMTWQSPANFSKSPKKRFWLCKAWHCRDVFPWIGFSVAALKSNSLTVGFDVPSIWALLKLTSAVVSQQQNGDLGSCAKSA